MCLREATPAAGRRDPRHEMEMEPTREVRQPVPQDRGEEWMEIRDADKRGM